MVTLTNDKNKRQFRIDNTMQSYLSKVLQHNLTECNLTNILETGPKNKFYVIDVISYLDNALDNWNIMDYPVGKTIIPIINPSKDDLKKRKLYPMSDGHKRFFGLLRGFLSHCSTITVIKS